MNKSCLLVFTALCLTHLMATAYTPRVSAHEQKLSEKIITLQAYQIELEAEIASLRKRLGIADTPGAQSTAALSYNPRQSARETVDLKLKLDAAEREHMQVLKLYRSLQAEHAGTKNKYGSIKKQLAQAERNISKMSIKLSTLQLKDQLCNKLQAEQDTSHSQLEENAARITTLEEELTSALSATSREALFIELREELDTMHRKQAERDQLIKQLNKQVGELKGEKVDLTAVVDAMNIKNSELEVMLNGAVSDARDAREEADSNEQGKRAGIGIGSALCVLVVGLVCGVVADHMFIKKLPFSTLRLVDSTHKYKLVDANP